MLEGRNILIYEGNPAVAIAAVKSCKIVTKADVEEVSSPASGTARTYKVTRCSWEVSVGSLVVGSVKDYLLRRSNTYFLTLKDRNNVTDIITGSAICTNVQIVATKGNLVQGSINFLGKDDISPAFPSPVELVPDFNDDYNGDYLI